jgi:tetratricopeptide (TPR) repeat protein
MRRLSLVVLALGMLVLWTAPAPAVAASDEIPLPPIRLKTDSPPPVSPIPPTPVPTATVAPTPTVAPAPTPTVALPPVKMTIPAPTPTAEVIGPPPAPVIPPKAIEIQKENVEAQVTPQPEEATPGLGEIGLVDEVTRARLAYQKALLTLKDFYMKRGNAVKTQWVDDELAGLDKTPKAQYLGVAELAGPGLKPTKRIDAADQLFKEGISFKDYPAFPPGKKDYLKTALEKFQTIIEKYPESDKIDDAAFRMGEIYGGWYFEDWTRAVQCYERCWQWNPKTIEPALLNAARIYEDKLKNRGKAIELYNRVITESPDTEQTKAAQDRLKALTGK